MINIIPFVQSDTSTCGPAVVKMILSYYGIDETEKELCKKCNHSFENGCDNIDMINAIESYDLATKVFENSTLEDLEYWIKHHVPVIVDWFAGGINMEDAPNGHSSIVVDIDREYVYLRDPYVENLLTISRQDFLRVWFDWKNSPFIQKWEDMVLRQAIIVYPKRLKI